MTSVELDKTVFDLLDEEIDYEACSSDKNNIAPMKKILNLLLPIAIKSLQKNMARFGSHIGEFYKYVKFEIP